MAEKNQLEIDDLKAPLLAAVGAADLALERVNEIVATLRERAGEARTDAEARAEASRARITKLQEELPAQVGDIRETRAVGERAAKLVGVELPKKAESAGAPVKKAAKKAPAKKAPAKKAPAKKAPAKKVTQK